MSRPRIRKLVEGVHMGLGHDRLAKLIKRKADIDVYELTDSDLIMCLNSHGDKMKILGCRGLVLGYLKMPNKQKIMKEALQFIPRTFGSGGFDYNAACRDALEQRFATMRHRKAGPLAAAAAKQAAGV